MPASTEHGLTNMELASVEKAAQWIAVRSISLNQLRLFLASAIADRDLANKVRAMSSGQMQSLLTHLQNHRR